MKKMIRALLALVLAILLVQAVISCVETATPKRMLEMTLFAGLTAVVSTLFGIILGKRDSDYFMELVILAFFTILFGILTLLPGPVTVIQIAVIPICGILLGLIQPISVNLDTILGYKGK